jgi:hypothetical protein
MNFSRPFDYLCRYLERNLNKKYGLIYRVENEEDLKPRPGININPPPEDGKCECCGRHISELKYFGKAGDPLVGDFEGSLLVKMFRRMAPPSEEAKRIYEEYYGSCKTTADEEAAGEKIIQELGEEEAERIEMLLCLESQVRSSWECRDCAVLDIYEYDKKQYARYLQEASGRG